MTHPSGSDADLVTALERGLAVLAAFRAERPSLTLSDVARETGLDRSGARRLLHTLVRRGYLRTDGQQYALHPAVQEIGNAYLVGLGLPERALPHLRALGRTIGEPALLAVLDGAETVIVARSAPSRLMSVQLTVGSRQPAHATALGRVLLAARPDVWLDGYLSSGAPPSLGRTLAAVRRQDFAAVEPEIETGLCAVAVAVRDADRNAIAGVGVTANAGRRTLDELVRHAVPALRELAARVRPAGG